MGKHTLALLAALDTACINVDELGQASAELFQQHPDYQNQTAVIGRVTETTRSLIGRRFSAEAGRLQQL